MELSNYHKKISSFLVHFFTSIGVIAGFFALLSVFSNNIVNAFLWLCLAFFIDGLDGPLARKVNVKEISPHIKGEVLDNIIDYFNYVVVPAFMVYKFDFVPAGQEAFVSIAILLVSCYTFSNSRYLTEDNYFRGFPAIWNVVIFYFYILQTSQVINLIVILVLCILTFIPLKYIHPFRVEKKRVITLSFTILWMITSLFLLVIDKSNTLVFWLWITSNIYFIYVSLTRSLQKSTVKHYF